MSFMINEKKRELVMAMVYEYARAHSYLTISAYHTRSGRAITNIYFKENSFSGNMSIVWDEVTNCYETFNTIVSRLEEHNRQVYKSMLNSTYGKAAASKPSGGEDEYDPEKGLAMAFSKKFLGNEYGYYNTFKHWLKKWDKQCEIPTDIQNFLEVIRAIGRANPMDVITKELKNSDKKDSDS